MPLREEIEGIGERIAAHFNAGGEPPFILYQYAPEAEWKVYTRHHPLYGAYNAMPSPTRPHQVLTGAN